MKPLRTLLIALCAFSPALALANAAMGYGLEMFDMRTWFVYVVATVCFEAWFIGRWLQLRFWRSLLVSIGANALTALLCPQCCASGLHSPGMNPNPLLDVLVLLTFWGLVSGIIEAFVWERFRGVWSDLTRPALRRSLAAHLLGVPLALAILLISPEPYLGLAETASIWRGAALRRSLQKYIEQPDEGGTLKEVSSVPDLLRTYGPGSQDSWTAAYVPHFGRFSCGEDRSLPLVWNRELSGLSLYPERDSKTTVWAIRDPRPDQPWGMVIDLSKRTCRWSTDPVELGYWGKQKLKKR